MHASHRRLFALQRREIQRQVIETSTLLSCPPWAIFLLLADLRSEFGRQVALHFHGRLEIDRTIRRAEAANEPPAFSVPLDIAGGLAIVKMFVPPLTSKVVSRPPRTVAMLIVDEHDYPIVAYGLVGAPDVTLS